VIRKLRTNGNNAPATVCVIAALIALLGNNGNALAQGLYVPNENSGTVSEFQGVLKSGTTPPHRVNTSPDLIGGGPSTVAFDRKGIMWVSDYFTSTIVGFKHTAVMTLKSNGAPDANIVINQDVGGNLNGPEGIVFDAAGNLWVGSELGEVILEYTPAQLAASGNPTPNIILNASSFDFGSPSLPHFDRDGNLWVVDEDIDDRVGGSGEVFKYNRNQIVHLSPGPHNIDPVIGIGFAQFGHLEGLAFNALGDIWLADQYTSQVYQFTAKQLRVTGLFQAVTPPVILTPTPITNGSPCSLSIDNPYGVAVDGAGNLYIANTGTTGSDCSGSLAKFLRASIGKSGSPVPQLFISSDSSDANLDTPNYLTWGPDLP
jgi:streptogramin lyase